MNREEFDKLKIGDIIRTGKDSIDGKGIEGKVVAILTEPELDRCEIHAKRLHRVDDDPEYLDEWDPIRLDIVDYINEVVLTSKQIEFIEECLKWRQEGDITAHQAKRTNKYVKEITDAFKKWATRP